MDPAALPPGQLPPPGNLPLDALYRAVSPFLYRLFCRLRVPPQDSEDLAQEVRIAIFRESLRELPPEHALNRFVRGEPGAGDHVRRWVRTIARHVVFNHRRYGHARHEQLSPHGVIHSVATAASPASQAAEAERRHALWDLLEGLTESCRTVLVMHYFEGLSACDIARELDIPKGTVFSRIQQAREDMRAAIRRTGGDGLRALIGTDDLDPELPDLRAILDGIEGEPAVEGLGLQERAWLGLLAALLVVGARGMLAGAGHVQANAEPQASAPVPGAAPSPFLWTPPLLLVVPAALMGFLYSGSCNDRAHLARTWPEAKPVAISTASAPPPSQAQEEDKLPGGQAEKLTPLYDACGPEPRAPAGEPATGPQTELPRPLGIPSYPQPVSPVPRSPEGARPPWLLVPPSRGVPAAERPVNPMKPNATIPPLIAVCLNASGCGQVETGLCPPGQVTSCYSGAKGTDGVGMCKPGTAVCLADGTGWGPCEGEVLPAIENCATPEDEDCDGQAKACSGELIWGKTFGGPTADNVTAIMVDPSGNIVLTGAFTSEIDFGGGPLMTASSIGSDIFLTKLDPQGNHLWSHRIGGTGQAIAWAVARDIEDNVIIGGEFSGTIDLGDGPITSTASRDCFLTSFDSAGHYRWSRPFPMTPGGAVPPLVVGDSAGNIIFTSSVHGEVDFGGGPMVSAMTRTYLVKYDVSGNYQWTRGFGNDIGSSSAIGIAVDGEGNIIIIGDFQGTVDFGGAPLVTAYVDLFVVKFDSSGKHLWSKQFGDDQQAGQAIHNVAVDSSGNVLIAGGFEGTIDLGGGPLMSAGGDDIFMAQLDPVGNHVWSRRFGDADNQDTIGPQALSVDHAGNILWIGDFSGALDFGGSPLVATGGSKASFMVKLDSSGNHLWNKQFAKAGSASIASDPWGNVVHAGRFSDTIDFGEGPLSTAGAHDIFLVKVAP